MKLCYELKLDNFHIEIKNNFGYQISQFKPDCNLIVLS